ncbi:MAG: diguanylate cyclase [Arcobacteraceae bacterium]|nr:diguanylate cyclase [Arcobacteraceae bacterium]
MTKDNFHKFFTIYFIGFGIIISLFGAFTSYIFEMNNIQNRLDKKAIEIFDIKTNTILKPVIESIDNVVKALTFNDTVVEFTKTNDIHKRNELEQLFLAIATSQNKIMQVRLLSKNGDEVIRIDRQNETTKPYIVATKNLQNKSERDYFQIVSNMTKQTIWHSKLDLNVENGKVEIPYKHTIRAAMPLFLNGKFAGMVIVNILTNDLFKAIGTSSVFEHFIIDKEKNYIFHPNNQFSGNKYTGIKRDIKEDFPDGLNVNGIYTYPIDDILNNDDDAILVLKTKENYENLLIDEKLNSAIFVLMLTVILSLLLAIYISKKPRKIQRALVKANEKLNKFSSIIDKYVITATTKPDSTIISVSTAFEQLSGYEKSELIGSKMNILTNPLQDKSLFKELWETILSGKIWMGEIINKKKNGESYWVDQHIIPTINDKNEIESFVSICIDITAKKELEKIASIDVLTGLYNRRMINEFVKNELETVKRNSNGLSIIMIDIDYFKQVNDTFGHQVGDIVLSQLSKLILENTRKSDIQGRYGGEEFIIICPQTTNEAACILAEKLRSAVENFAFDVAGHKTISLGVSSFNKNDNVESMIKRADDGLYQAKNSGRNRFISL